MTETSPGVFDLDHQVRRSMYGHGLFGDYTEVYLGRLLMLSDGFAGDPAFPFGGTSVIDHGSGLYYYAASRTDTAGS